MGCSGSSDKNNQSVATPKQRRRLSVGQVDLSEGDSTDGTQEEDRGMLKALNDQALLDLLKDDAAGGGGRKFSIGSMTDQAKTSFSNKQIVNLGDDMDPAQKGLGYTCRKGLKPESPNQDSWMVLELEGNFSIYGVFDGHGQKGHDVSNYVKETLPKLIIKDQRFKANRTKTDTEGMMADAFKKMQNLVNTADRLKKLDAKMSGTTCTICLHDHTENKIIVAHVADSTCVLGSYKDQSKKAFSGVALTRDHKPDLKDERARIEKSGGRVVFDGYANHRVYAKNGRYPGLNMSRCLGDLLGHADAGCSAEPEVSERQLGALDHVLLLCSDGVWEFITPQEAVDMVVQFSSGQAMTAAERLAKESWDRWIREEGGAVVDDITVLLVYLGAAAKQMP